MRPLHGAVLEMETKIEQPWRLTTIRYLNTTYDQLGITQTIQLEEEKLELEERERKRSPCMLCLKMRLANSYLEIGREGDVLQLVKAK